MLLSVLLRGTTPSYITATIEQALLARQHHARVRHLAAEHHILQVLELHNH